jgi:hypothetical protein
MILAIILLLVPVIRNVRERRARPSSAEPAA